MASRHLTAKPTGSTLKVNGAFVHGKFAHLTWGDLRRERRDCLTIFTGWGDPVYQSSKRRSRVARDASKKPAAIVSSVAQRAL